jgi:hypothetical protein
MCYFWLQLLWKAMIQRAGTGQIVNMATPGHLSPGAQDYAETLVLYSLRQLRADWPAQRRQHPLSKDGCRDRRVLQIAQQSSEHDLRNNTNTTLSA